MEPIISFIVTYHNEPEAFLQACLESIQALPLREDEVEILVVDDGSEVLPTFAGKAGIRYIRQEQAGLSVARNKGIRYSQGQYLQFVDADDYIFPAVYEKVLEQIRDSNPDLVLFKMTKKASKASKCTSKTTSGPHFLQHHNLRAAAWGYALRREILGDLRFYPGILHEDELFTPQIFLRANTLVDLDAKAYFYRQHEGTITHSKSLDKVRKRLDDIHFALRELQALDNPLLKRRIRQLTLDYLQRVWTLTHSPRELRRRKKELRKEGFLPLPVRFYSLRYFLASLLW